MRNFLLHRASQSAMNTMPYLTRIRFALVLRKIPFTLYDKVHFCGICIVMLTEFFFIIKRNTSATQIQVRLNLHKSRLLPILSFVCCCFSCSRLSLNLLENSQKGVLKCVSRDYHSTHKELLLKFEMQSSTSAYVFPTKEPTIPFKIYSRKALHGGRLEYYNDTV